MPGPQGEQCKTCYFWEKEEDYPGECKRSAPQPALEALLSKILYPERDHIDIDIAFADLLAGWPVTDEDAWCGEFKPREGAR